MTGDAPESGRWRRSSFCGAAGSCIEVRRAGGMVQLRESGQWRDNAWLVFTREEFAVFAAGVKAGNFDDLAPEA